MFPMSDTKNITENTNTKIQTAISLMLVLLISVLDDKFGSPTVVFVLATVNGGNRKLKAESGNGKRK